ncbi:uncharacterized protein BX663DRAFT_527118 [Cokeromyces recurvatus]|uniref:uncharacterized protein n=1 Tax=Cokeromyces recurvatus TaxID=90255 RepID=UPI00221F7726|nr:uncharacterized protein BX663DRAFT_527118 [Cokeromyces recurvatus]KAI7897758.1 hypothetical protein BX663DRAFT_527118 [Cokeromyces recurvatus]
MPRLLAYIRHLPAYQWEPIILKKGPPPSDMITYSLVAGLLKIADQCPEVYDQIIQTLWRYVKFIIQIMYENVEFTVTFILPSLAGFLRALQLSPYLYRTDQFLSLYENTKVLIRDDTLDLIQVSITSCLRDAEESAYSRCVLARYLQDGIPLSSNKFILDLLVIFRNILFRILTNNNEKTEIYPALDIKKLSKFHLITEKNCWNLLLQQPITAINDIEEDLEKCLKHVCEISLDHLNEIRKYCQEEKSWVVDAYMQEIMSISLHILSLITTYLQEVDDTFIEYINESLFNMPHVSDPSIHIASLDASALLAINFTRLSLPMINIICQFLAAPLHVFEYQIEGEIGLTNVQQYAIARLAQCIHIKPASQLSQTITFTIHTLLNKTARYTNSGEEDPRINYIPGKLDDNFQDFFKFEELNDEQKEQVCVNVLSSVIGIAIKLKDNYTTSQAFSMIVLRHKTFSAAATASLIMQLVDLALMSPKQTFIDIINYLATYSHESLYNEDNLINTSILSAQLSLAKRLKEQLEYYSLYLHNLLTLFIETANTIQRSLIKNKKEHDYPITKRLGNLLPIISALLEHTDFKPQHDKSNNMTPLFRNLWFHCVLFGFVTESMWIREWNSAMLQIAQKTPILMLEGTTHYFETELEHNSVLCGLQSNTHLASSLRQKLSTYLPTQDLKNLSSAQVTFALTVYHVEMLRSRGGDCAFHLGYFNHVSLLMTELLDTISEHVVRAFIKDASVKAQHQQLAEGLDNQIASLLKFCCHSRQKVHTMAIKTMDRIISAFPQAFTEDYLVTLLLELIQLMWLSCEAEYYDEYSPKFHFTSSLVNITIELSDSYLYRKEVFTKLYESARKWIQASLTRAPIEVSGLLQDYLAKINTEIGPHIGRTLALEMGRKNGFSSSIIPGLSSIMPDSSSNFIENFKSRQFYSGEISGMNYLMDYLHQDQLPFVWNDLQQLSNDVQKKQTIDIDYLHSILHRSASYAISIYMNNISNAYDIVHHLVRIPVLIFTPESLEIGVNIWNWLLVKRPELEDKLITEMIYVWNWAQRNRKGLFSTSLDPQNLFMCQMTYGPPNKQVRDKQQHLATTLFSPHVIWIKFFTSWFYSIRHKNSQLVTLFVRRVLMSTLGEYGLMSRHSLSRYGRFSMIKLGLKVLQSIQLEALAEFKLRSYVYSAAFSWFELPPQWHYGGHKSLALKEVEIMKEVYYAFLNDRPSLTYLVTCTTIKGSNPKIAAGHYILLKDKTKEDVLKHHKNMHRLLLLFIENELTRLSVWCNPLNTTNSTTVGFSNNITEKSIATDETWKEIIRFAWIVSPILTVQMDARFAYQPIIRKEVHRLIANNTLDVIESPEALAILLSEGNTKSLDLKYLQYWAPVPAITAVTYLLPNYTNPLLLQYAVRSLKHHSIDTVFFYIPQIVQALRHDPLGHVEDYILETAATSPLFAHQIIWNMKANFFVDADKECQKPDTLKPILERIIDKIVNNLTGEDQTFYEREFKFFGEVTAISGYLKEYIKHGQNEKRPLQKKRLDEELAKIKVDVGVYLPSNPDGYVIDIDRSSGRPLQSHAKAPFMATFLIEKENLTKYSIWQEAIFKVGDDCRQDVLALQLIAVFKSIFTSIGLDLYVYPYRVVATAPGRGVIDVIPNAISRDQLGREKVNSLYDYFVARYGDGTIDFQRARINFIQSVAAYSVISYILQFKDRHNGNIMIDDEGHMIHIDFGFIFDIAPGGIGFESSPFKLTTEMIQVMGGGSEEQGFRQFSELVVKAYLAARPYAEEIMQLVTLMLQSGLPCFKGDGMTMKRMKTRFQLDKTERSAANFMLMRIKDSFANQRTVLYDYFQKLTNGIPY